jgi:hypothetical protein
VTPTTNNGHRRQPSIDQGALLLSVKMERQKNMIFLQDSLHSKSDFLLMTTARRGWKEALANTHKIFQLPRLYRPFHYRHQTYFRSGQRGFCYNYSLLFGFHGYELCICCLVTAHVGGSHIRIHKSPPSAHNLSHALEIYLLLDIF